MNRITCLLEYVQANPGQTTAQVFAGIELERLNGNDAMHLPRSRDELDKQFAALVGIGRVTLRDGVWHATDPARPAAQSQGKMF